jgi:hypothetical protein
MIELLIEELAKVGYTKLCIDAVGTFIALSTVLIMFIKTGKREL